MARVPHGCCEVPACSNCGYENEKSLLPEVVSGETDLQHVRPIRVGLKSSWIRNIKAGRASWN